MSKRASDVIKDINNNIAFITLNCSCNYFGELRAFDEIIICMYLVSINQNKLKLKFEYFKLEKEKRMLVAQGNHEIGFFIRTKEKMIPTNVPKYFKEEIALYD
ncbi:MAG: acyl-CoA thioesterase [Tenacibaculum sp.]